MTSELECPFCEYELQENRTTNLCCPICGLVAPTKLWQALIQAKQDLEIATKAFEEIKENYEERFKAERDGFTVNWDIVAAFYARTIVENAIEQIEHKE